MQILNKCKGLYCMLSVTVNQNSAQNIAYPLDNSAFNRPALQTCY